MPNLKPNQIKLETAVEEQNKVLEQQKKDSTAIMESNKKLNVLINTFKKDLQDPDKRSYKENRDIRKLALERTKAIERIVNGGGKNAPRCIELASGAPTHRRRIKSNFKIKINQSAPLVNPNYVPLNKILAVAFLVFNRLQYRWRKEN